jgi:hypothetical protein
MLKISTLTREGLQFGKEMRILKRWKISKAGDSTSKA